MIAWQAQIFDKEWRAVYDLAEAVMARTMTQVLADEILSQA